MVKVRNLHPQHLLPPLFSSSSYYYYYYYYYHHHHHHQTSMDGVSFCLPPEYTNKGAYSFPKIVLPPGKRAGE